MAILSLGCECISNDCPPVGTTRGPAGPSTVGDQGLQGIQGRNAFSYLALPFTVPEVGLNGNAQLVDASFVAEGQMVAIETGGDFHVIHKGSNNVLILQNPGDAQTGIGLNNNALPGTLIGESKQVSPSGQPGAQGAPFVLTSPLGLNLGGTGSGTAIGAFNNLSPLAAKGQLIGFDGINNLYVPVGNDGDVLFVDSTASAGIRFGVPSHTTIPFDSIAPGTTKGDMLVRNTTAYQRLAVTGFNGYVLTADSTAPLGVSWQGAPSPSLTRTMVRGTTNTLSGQEQFVAVQPDNLAAPVVINLPTASLMGARVIVIKDETGNAGAQPIVIQPSDANLIQGASSFAIDLPYGRVSIYYSGTQFCLL